MARIEKQTNDSAVSDIGQEFAQLIIVEHGADSLAVKRGEQVLDSGVGG